MLPFVQTFSILLEIYDPALASSINIDFLKPANLDDKLIAIAQEINLSFRNGLYNVDVFNDSKELIASMRGRSVKKPKTTFI